MAGHLSELGALRQSATALLGSNPTPELIRAQLPGISEKHTSVVCILLQMVAEMGEARAATAVEHQEAVAAAQLLLDQANQAVSAARSRDQQLATAAREAQSTLTSLQRLVNIASPTVIPVPSAAVLELPGAGGGSGAAATGSAAAAEAGSAAAEGAAGTAATAHDVTTGLQEVNGHSLSMAWVCSVGAGSMQ